MRGILHQCDARGLNSKATPSVVSVLRSKVYRNMKGVATAVFRMVSDPGNGYPAFAARARNCPHAPSTSCPAESRNWVMMPRCFRVPTMRAARSGEGRR